MTPSGPVPNAGSSQFQRTTAAGVPRKHAEAALPKFNPEQVLHQLSVATANAATLRQRTVILWLFTGVCCFEYKLAHEQLRELRWHSEGAAGSKLDCGLTDLRLAREGAEIGTTPRGACCPVLSIDTPSLGIMDSINDH